jgi:hypothetical protein
MTSTVYNYRPKTGEFLSASPADFSPLEEGVLLVPANATDIKPPELQARQSAVFADGDWHLQPDWRGVPLVSTETGAEVAITETGVTPADVGATDQPRPSAAHAWRDGAWVLDAALQAVLEAEAQAALLKAYESALDAHLDTVARAHRYDSRFTFALRAGYEGPYHAEAVAFAQWMDACNIQAFGVLQGVLDGKRELPTIEALIADLTVFTLPAAA